ncbi:MAG: ABC transporter substrate-binding protein, partial [Chloroflexi bacterium]|nr:ABC transporter substrate-binding protein [Chloroflexota bacterium]
MKRKLLLILYALVVLSLIVSACSKATPTPKPEMPTQAAEATKAPAATKAAETKPTPTAKPAEGFKCDDPLGCVEIGPGDPIRIAYMLVVSGPNETLGIDSKRGIEIAIDDVGGELLGHPIELVGEDSQCSPEGGQAAAQKIAADKSIVGVIGTN